MFTETDEGKGVVRAYWKDVRKRVAKVEPTFARLVDELDPDESFPLYLAYYPYGELIGDDRGVVLPHFEKGSFRISEPGVPKVLLDELGYGMLTAPTGIVLEKSMEWFIDLAEEKISIPWVIYEPGTFFPVSILLRNKESTRMYTPNGVLSASAGARTTFFLPSIGCNVHHSNLQRDFNIQLPPPKTLYEHWDIFKEITNSEQVDCNWRLCLIYFSEKWLRKLESDTSWSKLRMYLYEKAWSRFEYERNKVYYDIAFSIVQQKRNLKPNPYLADIGQHLFAIALGAAPGYTPTINEDNLPLHTLQKVYVESYGLKKYLPTIMHPIHFKYETSNDPIYYSLQNRSAHIFSPQSRKLSSTIFEMRELEYIMKAFVSELSKKDAVCGDTILGKISNELEFKYFHNKPDQHKALQLASIIPEYDFRLQKNSHSFYDNDSAFSADAPFVRGCVSIKKKSAD